MDVCMAEASSDGPALQGQLPNINLSGEECVIMDESCKSFELMYKPKRMKHTLFAK